MIASKWMEAQNEGREIISIGDFNINSQTWNNHYNDKNPTDKAKHGMYKILKEKVLDHGNFQINSIQTRENENGEGGEACLDLAFSTDPNRISNHQIIFPTFSDHALVIINHNSNRVEMQKSFRKARTFKNFSKEKFSQDIINHNLYINNLYERDPAIISSNLQTMIQESLDIQAPVKVIQFSKRSSLKLSTEAREKLAARDTAHDQYKKSGHLEDLRHFKHLRNEANRMITK